MMTRQDFTAIAVCLDANHADLSMVLDFADMLGEQNERFNRALFVQAATGNLQTLVTYDAKRLARARQGKI